MSNVIELNGQKYKFVGGRIKLTAADYDKWRRIYHAIPDMDAELAMLDDYYSATLAPNENWFIRCSAALNKKHQEWAVKAKAEAKEESRARKFTGVTNTARVPCTSGELEAYRRRYPNERDATEVPQWWLEAHRKGAA